MKLALAVSLVAGASAFTSQNFAARSNTALFQGHIGSGGMADTRNPDAFEDEDPRKSISAAPSFEEYLKSRAGGGDAAPAPAPAPAAPPAYAPPAPVAAAPAPVAAAPAATEGGYVYGEYDDQLWDNDAKKDVYNKWDPNSPRSTRNFNPFETFGGNSPDASGIYPGEPRYKDPKRGDVSYAIMLEEKAEAEQRAASPKPGDVPGAPGRKDGKAGAPAASAPAAAAPATAAPPAYAPPAPAAAAPAPVAAAPVPTDGSYVYGEYDDQLWDNNAKKDVYNKWDPNSPRSTRNFNPFETFGGNSPDASGIYPGEPRYKDPKRGDVSFAIMLEEKAEAEQRAASPKPGDAPGAPGCRN